MLFKEEGKGREKENTKQGGGGGGIDGRRQRQRQRQRQRGYGKRGTGERYQNSSPHLSFSHIPETEICPLLLALVTVIKPYNTEITVPGQDTHQLYQTLLAVKGGKSRD